jgi:hypothetical protein
VIVKDFQREEEVEERKSEELKEAEVKGRGLKLEKFSIQGQIEGLKANVLGHNESRVVETTADETIIKESNI